MTSHEIACWEDPDATVETLPQDPPCVSCNAVRACTRISVCERGEDILAEMMVELRRTIKEDSQ